MGDKPAKVKALHLGRMVISPKLLFDWLDFKGAKLEHASLDNNLNLNIIIAHPDVPTVLMDGVHIIPTITPSYQRSRRKRYGVKRLREKYA